LSKQFYAAHNQLCVQKLTLNKISQVSVNPKIFDEDVLFHRDDGSGEIGLCIVFLEINGSQRVANNKKGAMAKTITPGYSW
jgi:hypothetical protein